MYNRFVILVHFSLVLVLCVCVKETKDNASGCDSVHLYQHAVQSFGPQHPTRHQGAAGAHAGCGP